jgi:CHAT domain-containing protein
MRAQKRARAVSTDQVTLLGIAAEHAQDPSLPSLHHVAAEAQHLVRLASEIGAPLSLVDSMATKQEVLAMFESANIVHLACHGVQHPTEPHKSRFCLSSGNLTVSELMDMNLKNASIAFLSACETAKGDQKYADEAVHLAATMLFAGFTSVVATMW